MEGKTVVMAVLLVSLVVGQVQVEAKICCPSLNDRNFYNSCRLTSSIETCVKISGCVIAPAGSSCSEEKTISCPCCPSFSAKRIYDMCRSMHHSVETCASLTGCIIMDRYPDAPCPCLVQKKTGGDAVNEYCKLGCVSSVCGAIATLENIDGGEVVDGAVEKCAMACSDVCTKNPIETA